MRKLISSVDSQTFLFPRCMRPTFQVSATLVTRELVEFLNDVTAPHSLNYVYETKTNLRTSRGKLQDTRCSTSLLGKVNNASVAFNKRCTDS